MRWWMKGGLGLLAVIATVAVGLASWDNLLASAPPADPVRPLHARIVRDNFGVPHIFGRTDADVAYGIAIAESEDDFPTLEETLASVRGRLGAITGPDGAKIDFALAVTDARRVAAEGYGALAPATRLLVEAYAQGLNEYAKGHPSEIRLRGLFPVSGHDIVTGFVLRAPFFYGLDRPLGALVEGKVPPRDAGPPDERGSNAFAVARSKSSDGAVRLIINSHQPWAGPVTWYELVVHSNEGWDFAGATFPGAPFPLLGHNQTLGWANTVNRPDLVDTYKLELNAKGDAYRLDGRWMQLVEQRVWLHVRFGPFVLPVPRTLHWAVHGPVIENARGAFALRWAGIGDARAVEQYYRINKARDWGEWRQAMAMQAVPGTNFVYADAAGHIAMVYNARFPARLPGVDWKGIVPGNRSDLVWRRYLPWSADPMVIDPKAGWVANSNNTPFVATAPADELDPKGFPAEMGIETYMTNRAQRFSELFAANQGSLSRDALLAVKFDKGYSKAGWVGRWMAAISAIDTRNAPALARAQALLKAWDWALDGVGPADTLATLVIANGAREAYRGEPLPEPRARLQDAVDWLQAHFGRLDVPLGDFQRLRRGKVDLPLYGGPDALRAVYAARADDGRRVADNGDGFIMLVEWDKAGQVRSQSIHQFGTATVRTASPHYADQSPLFARQQWKPVWFDPEDLDRHAERSEDM